MPLRPPVHRPAFTPTPHQTKLASDQWRGSRTARGYDEDWQRFRRQVLADSPLCQDCTAKGYVTAATEVHHILKVRTHPHLRLDRGNVMPSCKPCHSARTGRGE